MMIVHPFQRTNCLTLFIFFDIFAYKGQLNKHPFHVLTYAKKAAYVGQ